MSGFINFDSFRSSVVHELVLSGRSVSLEPSMDFDHHPLPPPSKTNNKPESDPKKIFVLYTSWTRTLAQWINIAPLQSQRTSETVPPNGAQGIIEVCAAMILHRDPHNQHEDISKSFFEYYRSVGDIEFGNRSLLDNILGVVHIIDKVNFMTPASFCERMISPSLVDYYTSLGLNNDHHYPRGAHASLLFSVIHGRLLTSYYNLPVAPDAPGALAQRTKSGVLDIVVDLFYKSSVFLPLMHDLEYFDPLPTKL